MTENHENGHDSEKRIPAEADNENESSENNSGVIELSDIAIGISPEDDAIVELTEELIGEADIAEARRVAKAVSDMFGEAVDPDWEFVDEWVNLSFEVAVKV